MNAKNLSFGIFSALETTNAVCNLGSVRGKLGIKYEPTLYATTVTVENALRGMHNVNDGFGFFVFPPDTINFETSDRLTFTRKGDTIQAYEVKLGGVTHKLAYTTVLNYYKPIEETPIDYTDNRPEGLQTLW